VETFHNAHNDRGGTVFSDHGKNAGTIIVRAFVDRHQLRVLDGIQLAAGLLFGPLLFITSDRKLYSAALKELPSVKLI